MPFALANLAMGTRFELVLPGDDPSRERAAGEAALEVIKEWDERLSLFRSDSLLSRINREALERPVEVDPLTFELLAECARHQAASQGAFDPAIGRRMQALGFRGEGQLESQETAGFEAVELDPEGCRVRFTRAGVQLDLGAVAKGHALDGAAQVLREAGIEQALIHGGTSTVVALGAPPDLPGWKIVIGSDPEGPLAVLRDQALSVSAQHGRRNAHGQGHVIDPRTGEPLEGDTLAAVVSTLGRTADCWSTALLVLGELPKETHDEGIAGLIGAGSPGARRWWTCGARGPFQLPGG